MSKEEVSWSDSSNDFSGIHLIQLAKTPRGKLRRVTDSSLIASVRDEIEAMKTQIIELSSTNAEKRRECGKLEVDLGAVTQALNGNLALIEKSNHTLRGDNAEAEREIAEKQTLLERAKGIFTTLLDNGVDMTKDDSIDYEYFFRITGGKRLPTPRQNEKMDPYAYRIVHEIPRFKYCRDNRDFLDECRKLVREVQGTDSDEPQANDTSDYRELLDKLNHQYQIESAKIAAEVKALNVRKDELLKELDSLKTPKRVTYTDFSHFTTPRSIKAMASPVRRDFHRNMLDQEPCPMTSCFRTPNKDSRAGERKLVFVQSTGRPGGVNRP